MIFKPSIPPILTAARELVEDAERYRVELAMHPDSSTWPRAILDLVGTAENLAFLWKLRSASPDHEDPDDYHYGDLPHLIGTLIYKAAQEGDTTPIRTVLREALAELKRAEGADLGEGTTYDLVVEIENYLNANREEGKSDAA